MKNTKIKIIVPFIALLTLVGLVNIVQAAVASINISPTSLTKNVGDSFNVSVLVNPAGNTVYAVEGTVVFNGVSCRSIKLADGVMPQTTPTCANPSFVLGLASGATMDKTLFTVSLNAPSIGTATAGITGANIIGAGVSISNTSVGGTYTIKTIPVVTPKPTTVTPKPVTKPAIVTPVTTPSIETAPATQPIEQLVEQPTEQLVSETVPQSSQLAAVGSVPSFGTGSVGLNILVGLVILMAIAYLSYSFIRRKRKNIM